MVDAESVALIERLDKVNAMIALTLSVASVVAGLFGGQAVDELELLLPLVAAEASEYPKLRDEILKQRKEPWDVASASGESWELGVGAFVLNARQHSAELFDNWDREIPRRSHRGNWYRLPGGSRTQRIAFRLERVWKPRDATDADRCLSDLREFLGRTYAGLADNAMWRAIWEGCPIEPLRDVSVFFLASSSDRNALNVIAE